MDDFAADLIASAEEVIANEGSPRPRQSPKSNDEPAQKRGWGRLSALREKASIQDRLVDKLLQKVIPIDGAEQAASDDVPNPFDRPNFNLTTMSHNFRRFNSRIGVVFRFQDRVEALLSWKTMSHTVSYLAILTFVCLDPYLLSALPIAILVFGILVPGFVARHPAPPRGTLSSEQSIGWYSPSGPPLAPAARPKPAKELSMDFIRNARDLQNQMGDFSNGYDRVVELLVPIANFSDEALSSTVFLLAFLGGIVMMLAAHMLPWRIIFLLATWAPVVLCHPAVNRILHEARAKRQQQQQRARIHGESLARKVDRRGCHPRFRPRNKGGGDFRAPAQNARRGVGTLGLLPEPLRPPVPGAHHGGAAQGDALLRGRPAARRVGMEREEMGSRPLEPRVGRGAHHHGRRGGDGGRAVGVRHLERQGGQDGRH